MRQKYGQAHRPRDYKALNESSFGKKFLFWFVIIIGITFLFLKIFYGFSPFPLLSPSKNFKEQVNARIQLKQKDILSQTPFYSSAVNMSAAINTIGQRKTTPQDLIKEIGLRKFKNEILPETVVKILQDQEGISAKIRTTRWLKEADKIQYLKSELAKGHPLLLFVKKNEQSHYLSIYGYEGKKFFLYDSLLPKQDAFFTVDNNDEEIGNTSMKSKPILEMWKKAEIYNMYKWVVISVEKDS